MSARRGKRTKNSLKLKSENVKVVTEIGPYIIRLNNQIVYIAQNIIPTPAAKATTQLFKTKPKSIMASPMKLTVPGKLIFAKLRVKNDNA